MLAAGSIGEAALSADVATISGAGGAIISEAVSETAASGDALAAALAMAVSLVEGATLGELATTPGASFDEAIAGSIQAAVAYAADGLWVPALTGFADWLAVSPGEDTWAVVAAGGDFWIKQ